MDTARSLIGDGVVPWKTDAKTHSTIWFFSKTLTEVEATTPNLDSTDEIWYVSGTFLEKKSSSHFVLPRNKNIYTN